MLVNGCNAKIRINKRNLHNGIRLFFQNRIQNILPTIYRVLFDEFEKCALKSKRTNGRVRLREKEKEGSYCDIDDLV